MNKGNVFMYIRLGQLKTCTRGNLLVGVDIRVDSFCKETSPDLEFLLVFCRFLALHTSEKVVFTTCA